MAYWMRECMYGMALTSSTARLNVSVNDAMLAAKAAGLALDR